MAWDCPCPPLPPRTPRGGVLGHDGGPGLKPCFLADEFQRLCVQGLPLLPPSYPGPFPGLPGFGSNGVGPGPGPARHSPHGSNGRGVPSLGIGNAHIGEAWDSEGGIHDLSEGVQASEGGSGLWSGGPGLGSRDEGTDSGLGVGLDLGSGSQSQGFGPQVGAWCWGVEVSPRGEGLGFSGPTVGSQPMWASAALGQDSRLKWAGFQPQNGSCNAEVRPPLRCICCPRAQAQPP